MALLGVLRPEVAESYGDQDEVLGIARASSTSGISWQAGAGRFGEAVWADDAKDAGWWAFDIRDYDWTGDTVFLTMNFFWEMGSVTDFGGGSQDAMIIMNNGIDGSSTAWELIMMPEGKWYFLNDNNIGYFPTAAYETYRFKQQCWNTIELSLLQSETNGILTIKVNGVVCMNAVDVGDVGPASIWDYLSFPGIASTSAQHEGIYYGDAIVYDDTGATFNALVGDFRIETILPDADGATVDWTRNTGASDYLAVDDAIGSSDDDTTYIESTVADEDSYMSYPASTLTDVDAILFAGIMSRGRDDGGVAPLQVQGLVNSNATVSTGDNVAFTVASTYEIMPDWWDLDPDTSAAWGKTGLDAAEWGVRSKT
jgi:hypothetical protein